MVTTTNLNEPQLVADQIREKTRKPSGYTGYTPHRTFAVGVSASDASFLSSNGDLSCECPTPWINPQTVHQPEVVRRTNVPRPCPTALVPGYAGVKPQWKATSGMSIGAYGHAAEDLKEHPDPNFVPAAVRIAQSSESNTGKFELPESETKGGYIPGTSLHVPDRKNHPGERYSMLSSQTLTRGPTSFEQPTKFVDWVATSKGSYSGFNPRWLPEYSSAESK